MRVLIVLGLFICTLTAGSNAAFAAISPCTGRCVLLATGAVTWFILGSRSRSYRADTQLYHDFGMVEGATPDALRLACADARRKWQPLFGGPFDYELHLEVVDNILIDHEDSEGAVIRYTPKVTCEDSIRSDQST